MSSEMPTPPTDQGAPSAEGGEKPGAASNMTTYTTVLRAPSSARLKPEQAQQVSFPDVKDIEGGLTVKMRTRWVNEGFEAPTPRELWIEATGRANSLSSATASSTAIARLLATILAFTANTGVGSPEVHIAYDTTPEHREREFLQVFVPDEHGIPREGRMIDASELTVLIEALTSSVHAERVARALYQYEFALRYWYFGGEWIALAHLYMAVEALTKAMIRFECEDRSLDESGLARVNGIDPEDPERPRWQSALEAWCRQQLIFLGDQEAYTTAKSASDGIEHGFMDLNDVNRHAVAVTGKSFGYVRKAVLRLLGISEHLHSALAARPPRDVASFRKIVRGSFVGEGNPAPEGEEYPYLKWRSSVKTLSRTGDTFSLSFEEKLTVRCAPGTLFRGERLEARTRLEPGVEPSQPQSQGEVTVTPAASGASFEEATALMTKANAFASRTVAATATQGIPPVRTYGFGLLAEQTAVFEAIQTLLADRRPVESLILLERFILGTCRLQVLNTGEAVDKDGIAIRMSLDSMTRNSAIFAHDREVVRRIENSASRLREQAEARGIVIPQAGPDLSTVPFYEPNTRMLRLAAEVARGEGLAVALHTTQGAEGRVDIRTQIDEPAMLREVAGIAVAGLVESTVSFAESLGWPYDHDVADELRRSGERLVDSGDDGHAVVGSDAVGAG
jgi:hypothetical protein